MNEITLDSLHPTLKEFNPNFVLIGDLKNIDKDIDKNGDSQASVNDVVLNWKSFNVAADETVSFDANPSYKNLIVSFGSNPTSNSELVGFKLTDIAGKDVINENSANEQVAGFTISVTSNTAKDAVYAGITDKVIITGYNLGNDAITDKVILGTVYDPGYLEYDQVAGFTTTLDVVNHNDSNYNTAIKTLHVPYYNNIELIASSGTGTVTTMEGGTQI